VVDLVLTARRVDWTLAAELERLAPYGPGHTEPMLAVTGMVVAEARRVGPAEAHIVFRLRRGPLPAAGVALDLAGTLERDTFGGEPRLRLRVADFADTSASPLLARRVAPRQLARAG
jgi:single-stranded-DNA-specific exonuclease